MNAPKKPNSTQSNPAAPRDPQALAPASSPGPIRAKRRYRAPHVVRWGSLLEMTQANGNSGNKDGGRKPYQRTR